MPTSTESGRACTRAAATSGALAPRTGERIALAGPIDIRRTAGEAVSQ